MRVSISNIAWDPPLDDEVGAILGRHGIDAVDVAPSKYISVTDATAEEVADVRRAWQRRGCDIVGMQSLLFGTTGLELFGDTGSRNEMLDRLGQVCRVGAWLGATRLVFGSPRNRDVQGRPPDEVEEIAFDFFTRLGDIAQIYGVRVLLEPNPREYGANFMTTSAETAGVVRSVGHPAIGMQLDLGAIAMNDESTASVLAASRDIIGHVHVSRPHLRPVVETPFLDEAAPAVRQVLPDAIACIEMLTTQGDVVAEIGSAVAYVCAVFGHIGSAA